MRFLVVDDSTTMRRIIINTLHKLGYTEIVDGALGDPLETFASIARFDDFRVAELVQRVDDDAAHRRRIVYHEKAHTPPAC